MTLLHLDPDSWVPPFEQLRTQIADQIERRELTPGHRLPPVRRLAADLGLAANTVARAYRELEQVGAVVTRGSRGTFVREHRSDTDAAAPDDVRVAAADYAHRAVAHGVPVERAVDLLRAAFDRHEHGQTAG